MIAATFILLLLLAGPVQPVAAAPETTAVRGIMGALEFTSPGPAIRPRPNQSMTSPVLVRIAEARVAAPPAGETTYRVEFIGALAGDIDLRDYLERADGSTSDIPSLPVRIVSQLEPNHGTDLFSSATAPTLSQTRYRLGLIALGVSWASIPILYLIVRRMRRRPVPVPPAPQPRPTLADQLRPLAEAARDGSLSIADRARLELLLYHYWRSRLDLDGPQAQVITRLRSHDGAGALLRGVERCIHAPALSPRPGDPELGTLLEPYRHAPAIAEPLEVAAAEGAHA